MNHNAHNNVRGNAFFITLVSVVLLGALTLVVSRQMSGGTAQSISDEKVTLYANELISYATIMENTIEQMGQFGVSYDEISFLRPEDAGYDDGIDDIKKLFHPSGGGMNWLGRLDTEAENPDASLRKGRYFVAYGTNVEWTPTSAPDVVLGIFGLSDQLCARVNDAFAGIGVAYIFSGTSSDALDTFAQGTKDFMVSDCPACDSKIIGCTNVDADNNIFYAVVGAR